MVAEKNVQTLQELQVRVELLLAYYRGFGTAEQGFVRLLECRQSGLARQLESSLYHGGVDGFHG